MESPTKDYNGNNIIVVTDIDPLVSRHSSGYTFCDMTTKITLVKYQDARSSFRNKEWLCIQKCLFTGYISECWLSERYINENCGIWFFNPIDGHLYEYTDKIPLMVSRPLPNQEPLTLKQNIHANTL